MVDASIFHLQWRLTLEADLFLLALFLPVPLEEGILATRTGDLVDDPVTDCVVDDLIEVFPEIRDVKNPL